MPELIGRTLGQYRIIEQIGQGGMATVYKAYQPGLDRDVALKILPPFHAKQPGFSERFRREAKAIANLHHPNILPVYDSGRDGDYSYLVMRYIDGARTLADVMRGRLTLEQVSNLIGQIASALSYAHRQGVIHRDIKPANVLMDGDWVLLTDFGLAKMTEASVKLTGTGVGMGTPAYMSPEQGQGKPIDHRTDIYALGVILYEMLTGQIPHDADTPFGIIVKRMSEPLPLPSALNPAVTEPVERVVLKALAADPVDRFDDAETMAAALREAIAGSYAGDDQRTQFSPPPTGNTAVPVVTLADDSADLPPGPTASRRKWIIPVGLMVLIAIIGAGAWLFAASDMETPDTEATIAAAIIATQSAKPTAPPTPQPTVTDVVVIPTYANTPSQSTATATPIPTDTPVPPSATSSPIPTDTPVPPSATPTSSVSEIITIANADQISEMQRVGRGTIEDIALSPDGDTLAVVGSLGVWLYDARNLTLTRFLKGHTDSVTSVVWSSDSRQLASGSDDGTVRLWDAATGETIAVLGGDADYSMSRIAWSPDGQLLASYGSNDKTVRLWDINSRVAIAVLEGHNNYVHSVVWSPDGNQLASGGNDGTVRLWDAQSGEPVAVLEGQVNAVYSVAWSPDGTQLASGGSDGTVRLWDTDSREAIAVLEGHTSYVSSVAWSPDGRLLASSGSNDKTVRLWDINSREAIAVLEGHTKYVDSVTWSPDGQRLASGSSDETVRLWDTNSGETIAVLEGHTDEVESVVWSPNGQMLAFGGGYGKIRMWRLWNTGSDETVAMIEGDILAWSPDGRMLASSGGSDETVRLWDTDSGETVAVLEGHTKYVTSVDWSPDGRRLASGGRDNTVLLWDTDSGETIAVLEGHYNVVNSVAWSPDGRLLASGSRDGTVRLWDAGSGENIAVLEKYTKGDHFVNSVAWSPDSRLLASGSVDRLVLLWDTESGEAIAELRGHDGAVTSVAWSPNGQILASSSRDSTVRLWDTASSTTIAVRAGYVDIANMTSQVNSVAWSPDGRLLASGSRDGTVRIWGIP